jgi:hypothetical protein
MITEEYIQRLLADIKAEGENTEGSDTMYREMMVAVEAERLLNYYAQLKDARYKTKVSDYKSRTKNREYSDKQKKEIKALASTLDEETQKRIDWALVGMEYTSGGQTEERAIQDVIWNIRRSISFKIARLAKDWSGVIANTLCKDDHYGCYFPKEDKKEESK